LHGNREDLWSSFHSDSLLSGLVLDWLHSHWLEDEMITLEGLRGKKHLLYLRADVNALQDCQGIEIGSPMGDSEIVQDYRKINSQTSKEGKIKVRRKKKETKLFYAANILKESVTLAFLAAFAMSDKQSFAGECDIDVQKKSLLQK
jgi:hypothetical protein